VRPKKRARNRTDARGERMITPRDGDDAHRAEVRELELGGVDAEPGRRWS